MAKTVNKKLTNKTAAKTPVVKMPAAETPAAETAAVTPAVETPVAETPAVETPAVETPAAKPGKVNKELHEQMLPYLKAYPKEKKFFVSSDGQVFLEANYLDAKAHQQQLDKNKDLITY